MPRIKIRTSMPSVALTHAEFEKRFQAKFYDPEFDVLRPELKKIIAKAWKAYDEYHKSPRTRRAGKGFADPDYQLPIEWLETRAAVQAAEKK
jgi:hypothetical protein